MKSTEGKEAGKHGCMEARKQESTGAWKRGSGEAVAREGPEKHIEKRFVKLVVVFFMFNILNCQLLR